MCSGKAFGTQLPPNKRAPHDVSIIHRVREDVVVVAVVVAELELGREKSMKEPSDLQIDQVASIMFAGALSYTNTIGKKGWAWALLN